MMPETSRFLLKARDHLGRAEAMLKNDLLAEDAGRASYLAAFCASQGLLFEKTGKVFKTHKGVQTEFLNLTRSDIPFDKELRSFLSRAYNFKAIADYETGVGNPISPERAAEAVTTAKRFVDHISDFIANA